MLVIGLEYFFVDLLYIRYLHHAAAHAVELGSPTRGAVRAIVDVGHVVLDRRVPYAHVSAHVTRFLRR